MAVDLVRDGTVRVAGNTLATPWMVLLLAGLTVVAALRAAPRFQARSRSLPAGLLVLTLLAYLNALFGYLPDVGDVMGPRPWPTAPSTVVVATLAGTASPASARPRGAVVALHLPEAELGRRDDVLVYLPPQYFTDARRRFPVLYLLHGSPGVPLDWFRGVDAATAGLVAARVGTPVILVAPRMSRGWLDDSECLDHPGHLFESGLLRDVVPQVDRLLRTRPAAAGRGLAGNSAGGYCALALALRHPTVFGHVLAMSALIRPSYSYGSLDDLFGHPRDLRRLVDAHTPLWLLHRHVDARRVQLRLDVGQQDPLLRTDRGFVAAARRLGVQAELVTRPGGHTYHVWRPALRAGVVWFGAQSA